MATRFWLTNTGTPAITPAFSGNWQQTGQAKRIRLSTKQNTQYSSTDTLTNNTVTVPITTTQNILVAQYISDPIVNFPSGSSAGSVIGLGNVSAVVRCSQNATTNVASLAILGYWVSQDGATGTATAFVNQNTDTAFALTASAATRILASTATTPRVIFKGYRLVIEIGVHATAPSAAGSAILRLGSSAASDFALTTALTTDLNPWIEFSVDLFPPVSNNYQAIKVGNGMSTGEKIR